jgi:alanyl-tRNA synthetase
VAFRLYDTFGVPFDFIEDTATTQGVTIDRDGYERAMAGQREKARTKSAFGGPAARDDFEVGDEATLRSTGDQFEGYGATRVAGVPIVALFDEAKRPVESLTAGDSGYMALAKTPFYLEAGGQVSDAGRIVSEATGASATVTGLSRISAGLPRAHRVTLDSGAMRVRDIVTAEVNSETRDATRRNHTATHLLHAALRQVLGGHVQQKGSLVAPDRLRFDFVHFNPVTQDELDRIEEIVNREISRNTAVTTEVRSRQEAIAAGAMALFGEKYGDQVRVVSVPDFSMELCGGTHVRATGDIGLFAIVSEGGVAAGVRRIEALTGAGAVSWMQRERTSLARIHDALHAGDAQAIVAIEKLQTENKRLAREVSQLKTQLALGAGGGSGQAADDAAVDLGGGARLARRKVAGLDKDALRNLADTLKNQVRTGVVIIASANDDKANIVVAVTRDLTPKIKAGQIVKEIAPIVGGGGGGRPDFAEAGGKHPERIDDLLRDSESVVRRLLGL